MSLKKKKEEEFSIADSIINGTWDDGSLNVDNSSQVANTVNTLDTVSNNIKKSKKTTTMSFDDDKKEKPSIAESIIKGINPLADKAAFIGKSAGSGLLSGLTGMADAPMQNVQEGAQKGKDKSKNENYIRGVTKTLDIYGITSAMEAAPEIYQIINDPNKKLWQKALNIGGAILNNNPAVNDLEASGQQMNMFDKNAEKDIANVRKKIEEPSNKLNESVAKDSEKMGKGWQTAGEVSQVIGNMLPSMALTAVTKNPDIGLAAMGVSAKGQATKEAEERGADLNTANEIGLAKGLTEVGTEKLTGGLKYFGKGTADDLVEKGINKAIKNKAGNFIAKQAAGMAGEVGEETISDLVDTAIDKATVDPDATYTLDDWKKTALTTLLSTGALNTISGGYSKQAYQLNAEELEQIAQNPKVQEVIEERVNNISTPNMTPEEVAEVRQEATEVILGEIQQNVDDILDSSISQIQQQPQIPTQAPLNTLNQGVLQQNIQTPMQEQTPQITPLNQVNQELQETRQQDVADSVRAMNLEQEPQFTQKQGNYVYEKSDNSKIDNLRKDAANYLKEGEQTTNFVNTLEKLVKDKDIEIRFDTKLGNNVNGTYKNGVITINPNSNRAGEFVAIHELTHAIGTKPMIDMIQTYRKSNAEFNNAVERLLSTYKTTEINEEALGDIAGQLFGNQEYINNLSMENPSLFKKIYNEIKYLWHQFTGYKNQDQFIEDLRNKWESAYRNQKVQQKAKNSNIEMSNQTDSNGNMLSNEQVDYFKNSKVRDKDGNLLVMYHGTNEEFNVFKPSKWAKEISGDNQIKGYFATDNSYSEIYGKTNPYYLNINNPLYMGINGQEAFTLNEWKDFFKKHGIDDIKFDSSLYGVNTKGAFSDADGNTRYLAFEIVDSDEYWAGDGNVTEKIKQAGYDGLTWTEGGTSYMPFNANQIKKIDNLTPTKNDDIRYSKEEAKQTSKTGYSMSKSQQKYLEKTNNNEKLKEKEFYSLYSAHKIFNTERAPEIIKSIQKNGFKSGASFGVNLVPSNIIYKENGEPLSWSDRQYAPKKGEYVLLVPENEVRKNPYSVKEGYKPRDFEVVQVERDYQPYYELYEKAYDKYMNKLNSKEETNDNDNVKQELDNSSFSLDKNAKRYEDLEKTRYIEYFTKDNGDVRINLMDSNNNLVNQLDLYNQREAIKELGEELGKQIYQTSNEDNQIYTIGNDINNLGKENDYFMSHRPTETGITADDLTKKGYEVGLPNDIYEHPEYYSINEKTAKETMDQLNKVRNNPDADITIYRATTGDSINKGDWITLSKSYAEQHNESQFNGKGNIVEKVVKAKDIQHAGDALEEWGYFPKENAITKKDSQGKELTKEQQEYFKDTKVRDNDGNLLEVYHWTPNKFTVFDKDMIGSTNSQTYLEGFYFADTKPVSNDGNVMATYLNITNPIVIDISNSPYDTLGAQEMVDAFQRGETSYMYDYLTEYENYTEDEANDLIDKWESADGVIFKNTGYDIHSNEYVAFEPNQIKNVDNTTPTEDPDIRYSKDNQTWREYLEKEFPSQGTRTNLQDINERNKPKKVEDTTKQEKPQETPKKEVKKSFLNSAEQNELESLRDLDNRGLLEETDADYKRLQELEKKSQGITKKFPELKKTVTQEDTKPLYFKYKDNEISRENNKILNEAKNIVEANKQGRRTKEQWLQVAEYIGSNADIKNSTDLQKLAMETWLASRPNTKDNLNRQGKKYVDFKTNEWFNAMYKGAGVGTDVKMSLEEATDTKGNKVDLKPSGNNTYEQVNVKPKKNDVIPDMSNKVLNIGNEKVSNFYSNITEKSKFITEENREALKDNANLQYYDAITNKETLENAMDKLNKEPEKQVGDFFAKKDFDAEDVATGWILVKRYQDAGNYEAMTNVIEKMREQGTKAGQAVQAYGILQRLTPEGMEYYSQKQLNKAFNEFSKNKSKKQIEKYANDFTLTAEEHQFIKDQMEKVQNTTDEETKKVEIAKIVSMLSDKMPPSKGQRIKAWMRIAMLGNPKTQVRNVMGNAIIQPVNWVGDVFSATADKIISKKTGVRTKGATDFGALVQGTKKGFKDSVRDAKTGVDTRDINLDRFEENIGSKPFYEGHKSKLLNAGAKALNKTNKILGNVMSGGDRIFYQGIYENSLKNQMKLNGVDTPTQEMIDIATNEALQRTWNDSNEYTKAVLQIRNAMNKLNVKGYGLGDVLIPFAKTPANLTKAIVDYSPAGLARTIYQDGKNLKNSLENGQYNAQLQHKFADSLGKGFAGTLLYLTAYGLAQAGITSGKSDDDKDVANFMRNTLGIQPYSIKIGDKSFTYDWAQPIAAPFSVMADAKKLSEAENRDLGSIIKTATSSASNILLEQSFLSSIQDVFNSYEGPSAAIKQQIQDLPARATPTFFKQIADLIDPIQRQTYVKGNEGETVKNKVQTKIPGASKDLTAQRDTLGREIKKYGGDEDKLKYAFNVFLNPANTNKGKPSEAAEEIYEVYKATGDKTIMPRQVGYSENIGGTTRNLTAEERNEWQKLSGEKIEENVKALTQNEKYNSMSDEDKAAVINGIVNYSFAKAKSDLFDTNISTMYRTAAKKEEQGIPLYDYYIDRISKRR